MKKVTLLFLLSCFISAVFSQKTVQIGNKEIEIKGESTYGCFAMEFVDNKPIAFEIQYHLDINGKNLTYTHYWTDVKGAVKAIIYICNISQLNLTTESIKISPANEKKPSNGEWNLYITTVDHKKAIKYTEHNKSGKQAGGKQDYLEIKLATKEKADSMLTYLLEIQKK